MSGHITERTQVSPPAPDVASILLAALPLAIIALDAADRIVFANRAAEEFFVTDAPRLRSARLIDFVGGNCDLVDAVAVARRHRGVLALRDVTVESPLLARSVVDATLASSEELAGQVIVCLSVARRPCENAGTTRASELIGVAEVLVHEIKNPLSGIRGAAQLLEASLEGEGRNLAVLVREEVDRIATLVDRIAPLDGTRSQKSPVNIHDVLRHVRILAERGFAAHVRFREVYDPSLPMTRGNRDQLVQAFLNLVKNAAEVVERGRGEIVLQTAFRPGVWRRAGNARRSVPIMVTVRDNGPGIPEAGRAFLFVPHVSKKSASGGLGLAVVAGIVNEHDGLIEVASEASGTEFRVYLPVAEGAPGP